MFLRPVEDHYVFVCFYIIAIHKSEANSYRNGIPPEVMQLHDSTVETEIFDVW
jgi:hypothetical protein